jgi:3-oxoacyl-[acyl-carrier-protein] synthase III
MTQLSTQKAPLARLDLRRGPWPCSILGTGLALPPRAVDNEALIRDLGLDTTADWIDSKTGIQERRFLDDGGDLVALAGEAALRALESSGTTPDEVRLIVVATSTNPNLMPSIASLVQATLLAEHAVAFDINVACSGFVHAFDVAFRWLQTTGGKALVVGADQGSRLFDPTDRSTAVFFGDAAAAVVIGADGPGQVLASELHSRGDATPLRVPSDGHMAMDGKAIWNFATQVLPQTVRSLCAKANVSVDQIQLLVPHQANLNILKASADELGLPMERVAVTVNRLGNTVAASIPTAMHSALREGMAKRGDLIAMVGFGAGLAWGGQLIRL